VPYESVELAPSSVVHVIPAVVSVLEVATRDTDGGVTSSPPVRNVKSVEVDRFRDPSAPETSK
jgi:hypothetical protein